MENQLPNDHNSTHYPGPRHRPPGGIPNWVENQLPNDHNSTQYTGYRRTGPA